jgi:diacylglycerol kinase family enzyme
VGKAVLIVNPFASKVTTARVEQVRAALPGNPDVRLTQARGHATALTREAVVTGAPAVYVFSGDGGFNEVLNGIDGSTPVGLIPGGGTSVLPRALGLPRDPIAAARRIAHRDVRRISVGRANGRRFGFNAGIGFDAELVRRVDELGRKPDGRRPGDLAFAWAAVRTLAGRRARYEEVLELEGLGRAAFALIANCNPYSYVGSLPLRVAPLARFELGLDVVAPRSVRARDLPRLVTYVVRGKGQLAAADIVYGHDLDRLVVDCDHALPLHVDGEDLGNVTEVLVECEREAVAVFV